MRQRTIILLAVILGVLVLAMQFAIKQAGHPSAPVTSSSQSMVGDIAPEFSTAALDGTKFDMSDNIGKKVVVLNFFATWCGPCRQEIPDLNELNEYLEGKDAVLIGINCGEDADKVGRFVSEKGMKFPVAIDQDGTVRKMYNVNAYPTTVLVGADGTIQLYRVGSITYDPEDEDGEINRVISENLVAMGTGSEAQPEEYYTEQNDSEPDESEDDGSTELKGRARNISFNMYCPCGCDHLVASCGCRTAEAIEKDLSTMDFGEMTDEEIIKELNRKHCVIKE